MFIHHYFPNLMSIKWRSSPQYIEYHFCTSDLLICCVNSTPSTNVQNIHAQFVPILNNADSVISRVDYSLFLNIVDPHKQRSQAISRNKSIKFSLFNWATPSFKCLMFPCLIGCSVPVASFKTWFICPMKQIYFSLVRMELHTPVLRMFSHTFLCIQHLLLNCRRM